MSFLLTVVVAASLAGPARPAATVEPDSGSVAFTTADVWLQATTTLTSTLQRVALLPLGARVRVIRCEEQTCNVEFRRLQGFVPRDLLRTAPAVDPAELGGEEEWNALELLMGEHHFAVPIYLIEKRFSPSGTKVAMVP